jgi:multidrug resistance protein
VASFVGSTKKKEGLARAPIPVSDLPKGIVGWENQEDPAMPLNFSERRKWTIIFFLSVITLMTPFASSILAPGIFYLDLDFNNSSIILGSLPVSIYLLGYAAGPLVLAGLSEIYGRHWVLVFSNVFFCVWQIGCALAPSLNALIVFRLLAGIGGSACLVLGGGIIADLFPVERRGFALSIWTLGPLVGPSLGPLAGAFIAQSIGWRWDFWIVLIPAAIATGVMAIFSEETNHRVLINRKLKKMQKETGRDDLKSCYETPNAPPLDRFTIMKNGLIRPLKMLALAPVLVTLSMYVAFACKS